jgi:hypothetical protein
VNFHTVPLEVSASQPLKRPSIREVGNKHYAVIELFRTQTVPLIDIHRRTKVVYGDVCVGIGLHVSTMETSDMPALMTSGRPCITTDETFRNHVHSTYCLSNISQATEI